MRWAEPGWLLLVLFAPLPWLFDRARPRIAWPSLTAFARSRPTWASRLRGLPVLLRGLAIALLAVALARPQTVGGITRVAGQGVAIVVALDHSSSMNAVDFPSDRGPTSRLDAAKTTLAAFIEGRPDDPIGLVVFANYPDRISAPTLDHAFLLDLVRGLRSAPPGDDGTNIGDAIALALGDLVQARPKKKVLVLLTDGRNEPAVPNPLDPVVAARLARDLGVTLHTIAIGKAGGVVRVPEADTGLNITSEVAGPDYDLLDRLARDGGGRAFAATDARALGQVFQAINALETSSVRGTVRTRYHERFGPWVGAAFALLILDRLLSAGQLRHLP